MKTGRVLMAAMILLAGAGPAMAQPASDIEVNPDIVFGHKLGMGLIMDCYRPAEPNGAAVIFVNSGGFVSGKVRQFRWDDAGKAVFVQPEDLMLIPENFHYEPLEQFSFVDLLAAGFTVFDVMHGCAPVLKLDDMTADIRLAVEHIRTHAADYHVDADRLGICGASAGGYLALYEAFANETAPVKAAAALYPAGFDYTAAARAFPQVIESLPALQIAPALLDSLSLKHHLTGDDPPLLLVWGREDFPFITNACDSLAARCQALDIQCRTRILEGSGHEFRGPDGYNRAHGLTARKALAEWFLKHLN